jgi:hypothetical protein
MRPNQSRLRKRALHVAFAVSWASSLQFAGCLNNTARTDLTSQAEKAALHAEQSLAEREAQTESLPSTRVELAGGTATDELAEKVIQTGGEVEQESKSSFWAFWKKKPKAETTDASAQSAPVKTADKSGDSKVPVKSATSSALVDTPQNRPLADAPVLEDFNPENWFEQEFAAAESRLTASSLNDARASKLEIPPSKLDSAGQAAQADEPAAPNATRTGKSSVPDTFWDSPNDWASAPVEKTNAPAAKPPSDGGPFGERTASRTSDQAPAAKASAVTAGQSSQPVQSRTSDIQSLKERQQLLRIHALMSDAHTSQMRGELHAAYRSALLAEKIAREHRLTFTGNQENPSVFARAVAAQIWPDSQAESAEQMAAASVQTPAAESSVVAESPAVALQKPAPKAPSTGFPDDSFAVWTPAPGNVSVPLVTNTEKPVADAWAASPTTAAPTPFSHSPFAQSPSSASAVGDLAVSKAEELPQIRPGIVPKPSSTQGAGAFPELPVGLSTEKPETVDPHATALETHRPLPLQQPEPVPAESNGVQFAIAQSVSPAGEPQLIDPFESSSSNQKARKLAQRPVLVAPLAPESNDSRIDLTWDEMTSSSDRDLDGTGLAAAPSDTASQQERATAGVRWRTFWAVLGLLGTGGAIVVGLKMSRRDTEDQIDETMLPKLPVKEQDTSDTMQFKIKRAA